VSDPERIRRRPDVLWRRSLQAVVLLPAGADETYTMGGTGIALWELLAEWRTADDIVAVLADVFGADPEVVRADVTPILDALTARGAIETGASVTGAGAG
jgi:coenzyme PQQ synthesis protein D (PqqD)